MVIRRVLVCGTGQMGSLIAQLLIQKGIEVILLGRSDTSLRCAVELIKKNITSSPKKDEMITLLSTANGKEHQKFDVDLAIEAVVENRDIKKSVINMLDKNCSPRTIIATVTSSFRIELLAEATKRSDRVIGMHFFNPPQTMKIVELICGSKTSSDTFKIVNDFCEFLSKTPIKVLDKPGFVANRIIMTMVNEAVYTLADNVAEPEQIDQIIRMGFLYPKGPLALADFIGIDTVLEILEEMLRETGDSKYQPCKLLYEMVRNGYLGIKTGRGFFQYTNNSN